jgi:hypothetical protein
MICLVLFLSCFLAAPFTRERFFHSLLLARLQVRGVTLHFLNDVLLLYLPLEAAKRIFNRFAFLNSNLCQKYYTPPARPN